MTARESADDSGGSVNLILTRFERHRASHPVFATELPDPGTGVVLEKFRAELSCKICCNLLKDPVLSRTCMHRFCTGCVVNGSQIIATKCPECNVQFSGNPAFLRDHNFTELIKKLLPKECDVKRRGVLSALRATGVDVDGYFREHGKTVEHRSLDNWTAVEGNFAGPSSFSSSGFNSIFDSKTEVNGQKPNGIGNQFKLNGTNGTEPGGFNRNTLWRMQMNSKSVIHMITENGALRLMMDQLDHLPFILNPESVRPVTGGNLPLHPHQTYSLCNSSLPTHLAELESVYMPTRISKESKKLLISLPIFILKLFPHEFFNLLMKERESIPDEPLLTLRQKINRGMLLVNHLKEFIIARASVEGDFRAKDEFKIEFATVLCEKNEINIRVSRASEEATPGLPTQQKGEFVWRLRCGKSPFVDKRSSRRDTLIILKHPFQALERHLTVKNIATNSRVLGRPLKIVFRLVPIT
ncbi:hypothetical protein FO519_000649 [Halicephalobus sp. NKZ332]|nr:hypothetical protein FO519_000649 [Halicephalobus sp. NKZ332]